MRQPAYLDQNNLCENGAVICKGAQEDTLRRAIVMDSARPMFTDARIAEVLVATMPDVAIKYFSQQTNVRNVVV